MDHSNVTPENLDHLRDLQQANARARLELMNHLLDIYPAVNDAPESLAPMLDRAQALASEVLATQLKIDAEHVRLGHDT